MPRHADRPSRSPLARPAVVPVLVLALALATGPPRTANADEAACEVEEDF